MSLQTQILILFTCHFFMLAVEWLSMRRLDTLETELKVLKGWNVETQDRARSLERRMQSLELPLCRKDKK